MYKKIIFLLTSLIICIFSLLLFFGEKQEFSQNENRYLTTKIEFTFDKLLDGTFIKNVEEYLTDQFPFRNTFLSVHTSIERLLGKKDINDVYISKKDYLLEKYDKPINNDKIINTINKFNKLNNINFNIMLVPTSIEINKDLLPLNAITNSQRDEMKYIYNKIEMNYIDIYDEMKKRNSDYQMFYRLDHHWTSYAAYYAYVMFTKQNNLEFQKLYKYDILEVTDDFNGTLYSKSNYYKFPPDKIHKFKLGEENLIVDYVVSNRKTTSLYEDKYLSTKDKYSYFLDNNHPLIKITNKDLNNNNEIIVIKDSFANTFIPFLTKHYEKIHVIDPRFYKTSISDYIKENKNIKDGLILYNMQTIDNDTGILSIK